MRFIQWIEAIVFLSLLNNVLTDTITEGNNTLSSNEQNIENIQYDQSSLTNEIEEGNKNEEAYEEANKKEEEDNIISTKQNDGILSLDETPRYNFKELLEVRPLPKNFVLTSFQFNMESDKFEVSNDEHDTTHYSHFNTFPKAVKPLMSSTNARQLHLRFTRGFWDAEEWGQLPHGGEKSGGTGVELWAIIEAPTKDMAFLSWTKLVHLLSGMFCASMNFIDSSKTTFPVGSFSPQENEIIPIYDSANNLFLVRGSLANEPVCTENLTPFVKLLPTKGKSGISTLLDGHKIFDSIWHSLSIDVNTICDEETKKCFYTMEEFIETVINVPNTLSRMDRPIPKPLPGDELRCDTNKPYDAYQCFPLPDPSNIEYSLSQLFGRMIRGGNMFSQTNSKICATVTPNWNVFVQVDDAYYSTDDNCFDLKKTVDYDLFLESADSKDVLTLPDSPIYVSRSLTGYGQDRGGLRSVFTNPTNETVELVYFETLPWFMGVYLSTLTLECDDDKITLEKIIQSTFYLPAKDRERPTHLENKIIVPPNTSFAISYQFDKSLLKYAEYPPDANHGFNIDAAVVTVVKPLNYQSRTASSLLYLSTPDFSMPYNVIILTSTIMGLAFGTLFNLMVKRLITLEEADKIVATNSPRAMIFRLKSSAVELLRKNTKIISKTKDNKVE